MDAELPLHPPAEGSDMGAPAPTQAPRAPSSAPVSSTASGAAPAGTLPQRPGGKVFGAAPAARSPEDHPEDHADALSPDLAARLIEPTDRPPGAMPHFLNSRVLMIGAIAVAIGLTVSWIGQSTGGRLAQSNPVDPQLAVALPRSGDRLVMDCPGRPELSLGRRWDVRSKASGGMVKIKDGRETLSAFVVTLAPHLQPAHNFNLATPVGATRSTLDTSGLPDGVLATLSGCRFGVSNGGRLTQAVITDISGSGMHGDAAQAMLGLALALEDTARRFK